MSFEPRFGNLVDVYKHSLSAYPDNRLFGVKRDGRWEWMTYREFGEATEAARGGLAHLGIEDGQRVAIISNNRPEWAVVAYACYGLAAAIVPMYEAQKDEEWLYILGDCEARVVFVADVAIADRVAAFSRGLPALKQIIVLSAGDDTVADSVMTWEDFIAMGGSHPAPLADPSPDTVCGFIYTSGTTGRPKGVQLMHSNIAGNVSAIHQIFPMADDDCSLSFLPWAHSFGQTVELQCLFSMGASMGIAESVPQIVANLAEVQPTILASVPRIFNKIYDGVHNKMAEEGGVKKALFDAALANARRRRALAAEGRTRTLVELKHALFDRLVFSKIRARFGGKLKYAFSGGAALSKEVAEFIDDLGVLVFEGYGLTETSPIASCNFPEAHRIGTVGKPIPGVRVEIDREATGHEVDGEIVVYGHCVMKGYHGLPKENAAVFTEDGGFRTGDMGRFDDDGFLVITGRIKEQYKLENGKYVVPTPLEELLKLSPYIAGIMVFGDNRPHNVALVVPDLEVLQPWAAQRGLPADDIDALLARDEVRELYDGELVRYGAKFKQYEKIKGFGLIAEDFTTENGMLTPSLKLKRRVVVQRYNSEIERLYA